MKNISEHLGEIIVALAAIALLITSVVFFRAPIGIFFSNIVEKETAIGEKVFANLDNVGMFDGEGGSNGGSGSGGADGGSTTTYEIISGAGQTYSSGKLSFTSNAPFSKFAGVKVNNEIVDPVNYTVEEGSTIITFTEAYSQVLANGDYNIEVLATDGKASAPFNVNLSASTPSIDPSDIVGTWKGETYDLILDNGMGKMLNAAMGMEQEIFDWELDENGDIVFDVSWVAGGSPGFYQIKSVLHNKAGVISADGNIITVGSLTFTRN